MTRLLRNLTFWVLLAIIAGAITGYVDPALGIKSRILGETFISIIKGFIPPLIFLTITGGIAALGDLRKVGRIGLKALVYFEVVTTFALVIGVTVSYLIQPGAGVMPQEGDVSEYVHRAQEFSWWTVLRDNITLQVLIVALVCGVALSLAPQRHVLLPWLHKLTHWLFTLLRWVMLLSPIGAFGGMAFAIGRYGLAVILALGKLMLCIYLTMAIFIFVVLGWILRRYGISIWQFLKFIKAELLIVLGTSSSESALPSLMQKLELFGCSKPVVGLVVPAGYSFNLDGTTIYLAMATMFLVQVYGVSLTPAQIVTLILVLMLTSKGAAGVTGSGFVVLASTMAALNVIPLPGIAILLGVDRFMSEARAITNIIGNGVATVFLSNHEKDFDRSRMQQALQN
ncbi:MAG TPA: cation:dicarboxylase symporter family transporter [Candidatus Acidoferrum sp.]|nr:cation:dicarboxylase symporter family transporter [Candidatus Acidoferrum sp.]